MGKCRESDMSMERFEAWWETFYTRYKFLFFVLYYEYSIPNGVVVKCFPSGRRSGKIWLSNQTEQSVCFVLEAPTEGARNGVLAVEKEWALL